MRIEPALKQDCNKLEMEFEDKKRFYVQTINSLWVLRGSFRKMQHKKKSYTLIVLPKRRVLPKILIEW